VYRSRMMSPTTSTQDADSQSSRQDTCGRP
jgi:hypothetical protein